MSQSLSNALCRASSTTRFIPPSRHLSLPSKNAYRELFCISSFYFVFSLKEEKKKSWRRDALTWVKVSREPRISKKQIFSKLLPRMSQCDLFIIFFKKACSGEEKIRGIFETRSVYSIKRSVSRAGNGAPGVVPVRPALPLPHFQLCARFFAC